MTTIIEKIINGVYDDEVIDAIRNTRRNILFDEINIIVNNEEKADEILKTALEKAGMKYTICEETGRIITYLEVERFISLYGTMDFDGNVEDDEEDEVDCEYYCPHCGRQIYVRDDDEAVEIIKGEKDEYGNPK